MENLKSKEKEDLCVLGLVLNASSISMRCIQTSEQTKFKETGRSKGGVYVLMLGSHGAFNEVGPLLQTTCIIHHPFFSSFSFGEKKSYNLC